MNIIRKLIGTALLLLTIAVCAAPVEKDLAVYVRVFKIPRIQNWVAQMSDGNGGFTNVRAEGDLTAVFPDGVVLLQTELAPIASDSAVIQTIRDRIYFGRSSLKADRISIKDLTDIHWHFNKAHMHEESQFEKEISPQQKEIYELWAGVESMQKDKSIMKLRFDSGWSSSGGRLGASVIGTIFEQTIIVPKHKILLIGFPSQDKGPRGTVYWLAIAAQPSW